MFAVQMHIHWDSLSLLLTTVPFVTEPHSVYLSVAVLAVASVISHT